MSKINLKSKTIVLDAAKFYAGRKLPANNFKKAAKSVVKSTAKHFKTHGWDLDYNFLITDIFYGAMGHHLEDYLWTEIVRQNVGVTLSWAKGRALLTKNKRKTTKKEAKHVKKAKKTKKPRNR